ncbi:hypothetical protein D3C87_2008830 [compost metagenome]
MRNSRPKLTVIVRRDEVRDKCESGDVGAKAENRQAAGHTNDEHEQQAEHGRVAPEYEVVFDLFQHDFLHSEGRLTWCRREDKE